VIALDADAVKSLPVDELSIAVLRDLIASQEWNEWNYINAATQSPNFQRDEGAQRAISEALTWLRSHALIARTPGKTTPEAIFVTREGHDIAKRGLAYARSRHRLQEGLHPQVERVARPQFLLGQYELAVFAAMKAVEVRVRAIAGFGDDVYGVDLMNRAFGLTGPLTDSQVQKGEQDGTRALFAGAYAVLRNPSGHRDVDYDDVAEAAEAVTTASLLMRVLDKIQRRLSAQ